MSWIKASEQDDFKHGLLHYLILFLIAALQFSSPYRQRAPAPLDLELTLLHLAQMRQMGIQTKKLVGPGLNPRPETCHEDYLDSFNNDEPHFSHLEKALPALSSGFVKVK